MEAIGILGDRQAQAEVANDAAPVAANAAAIRDDGTSWVGGNPDGDATMVEFMDCRRGCCRKAHPEVEALLAADSNIRLVVKKFPILGQAWDLSSRFAIATPQINGIPTFVIGDQMLRVHVPPGGIRDIVGQVRGG